MLVHLVPSCVYHLLYYCSIADQGPFEAGGDGGYRPADSTKTLGTRGMIVKWEVRNEPVDSPRQGGLFSCAAESIFYVENIPQSGKSITHSSCFQSASCFSFPCGISYMLVKNPMTKRNAEENMKAEGALGCKNSGAEGCLLQSGKCFWRTL